MLFFFHGLVLIMFVFFRNDVMMIGEWNEYNIETNLLIIYLKKHEIYKGSEES